MAKTDVEPWVQLATKIPKALHREVKLCAVRADVRVQEFVVAALRGKLERDQRRRRA